MENLKQQDTVTPSQEAPPQYSPPTYPSGGNYGSNYNTNYGTPIANVSGGYSNSGMVPGPPGQQPLMVVTTQPTHVTQVVQPVPDYFGLAIFATLCCFWPLGLVAIFRSRDSRDALVRNDYANAIRLAEESKRFSTYAIICGAVMSVISVVLVIVIVSNNTYYY